MESEFKLGPLTITIALVEVMDDTDGPHPEVIQTFSAPVEGELNVWSTSEVFTDYCYELAIGQYEYLVEKFRNLTKD